MKKELEDYRSADPAVEAPTQEYTVWIKICKQIQASSLEEAEEEAARLVRAHQSNSDDDYDVELDYVEPA